MNTKKNTALSGAPFGYIAPINEEAGTIGTVLKFANLQNTSYAPSKSEGKESEKDKITITRADGAEIVFDKQAPKIDGADGKEIKGSGSGNDSNTGSIKMLLNEADEDANSWTEGVSYIINNVKDKPCLVALATGFTYAGLNAEQINVDGWAYLVGTISNDIEVQGSNAPSTLQLDFSGSKLQGAKVANIKAAIQALTFTPITYYRGKDSEATVTAPKVEAPGAELLIKGDLYLKPTATNRD